MRTSRKPCSNSADSSTPNCDGRSATSRKRRKAWGWTQRLVELPELVICRANGKAGKASSLHLHDTLHNAFFVLDGCVRVDFQNGGTRHLKRGQSLVVPAGTQHRMVFVQDSELLEIYYTDGVKVDPNDIRRMLPGW